MVTQKSLLIHSYYSFCSAHNTSTLIRSCIHYLLRLHHLKTNTLVYTHFAPRTLPHNSDISMFTPFHYTHRYLNTPPITSLEIDYCILPAHSHPLIAFIASVQHLAAVYHTLPSSCLRGKASCIYQAYMLSIDAYSFCLFTYRKKTIFIPGTIFKVTFIYTLICCQIFFCII